MSLLQVRDLHVDFGRHRRVAVDGVDLTMEPGERLGLIGESGSGKSVTALSIMGLLPGNAHVSGSVTWRGEELLGISDRKMSRLRGTSMAMVFQEPMTALDPTMRVGRQIGEVVALSGGRRANTREVVLGMLETVGIREPRRVAQAYPHQLSGGQRQRALLALALVNSPDLLICDEPTTALDVTVQARVLETIDDVLTRVGAACLFISHDLAVVSQVCDEVVVMHQGTFVERGAARTVFNDPKHPYTRRLVGAARLDAVARGQPICLERGRPPPGPPRSSRRGISTCDSAPVPTPSRPWTTSTSPLPAANVSASSVSPDRESRPCSRCWTGCVAPTRGTSSSPARRSSPRMPICARRAPRCRWSSRIPGPAWTRA